jgi:hypothetical protein
MTQNPYAGDFNPDAFDAPERTSALAVASLVLSLICCIPGLGLLGAGLGVGSIISIGGSRGRVGGKGLAIAGILIGMLVTFAWVGVYLSAQAIMGEASQVLYGRMHTAMEEVEAGNYDGARAQFDGAAAGATDEQFEAFRAAYRSNLGSFQSVPTKWSDIFSAYMQVGQQIQNYQGRQNMIPIPANFDNGPSLMLAWVDPTGGSGSADPKIPMSDLWVVLADGTEIRLMSAAPAAPAGESPAAPGDEANPDDVP